MTTVTLTRDGSEYTGYWYTVEAKDHATGSVPMCAAISTLVQTLDTWLKMRKATVSERKIASGHCKLRFTGKGCATAFEMAYVGFERLQSADPEHIKVSIKK